MLFNSIVRGFGMTLGRKAADKVTRTKERQYADKNYLTFWEGIKTILWFPVNMITSTFVVCIFDFFIHFEQFKGNKIHFHFNVVLCIAIIFTFIIGYDYYNKTKHK